jgi:hypothetical protein
MRRLALACVAVLAIALAASPARAIAPSGKAAVSSKFITPINGRLVRNGHRWGHRHAYRNHHGFYRDGFALMYAVHRYPRGIVATFGYPRDCYCDFDR